MSTALSRRRLGRDVGGAWLWAERMALAAGVAALVFWSAAGVFRVVSSRQELKRFAARKTSTLSAFASPDLRLWSPDRVRAWQNTQNQQGPAPLAVLRIRRIGLEVPVLEGTDEWTLNRGAGHIEETAMPGTEGNAGIAGHRDGFFRSLKDIHEGDVLELDTIGSLDQYRVEQAWVVEPDDVSVLDATASPSITLVTCYPFYFVGSAPERFIVRAVHTGAAPR